MNNDYKTLVGKPDGKRPPGRHRHRWEDDKMDVMEIGWEGVDWIYVAQGRSGGKLL
jgi:hypothetical protein